jgi:hypothetical protein
MSEQTWGYSNPVGEWAFSVAISESDRSSAIAAFWSLLRRVVPIAQGRHRLRGAVISWAEYDAEGNEQQFHELEDVEDVQWDTLEERLTEALRSQQRVAVSSLFLSMDTQIQMPSGEPEIWADDSAELQLSFVAPELNPPAASILYSTSIDVWLAKTFDAAMQPRSNAALAALNLPHLQQLLAKLAALASRVASIGQSRLYGTSLIERGFIIKR